MREIHTPLDSDTVESLAAGDRVLLTGVVYTARDSAHARLVKILDAGGKMPVDLNGQVIYYVGPTPAPPGRIIGSAGPTTAGRMDAFTSRLLSAGLKGMIGKGLRSPEVVDAIRDHKAVYFGATGGAAALLAQCVVSCEVVAYADLGCEAIHKLEVVRLPLVVINDSLGRDFYRQNQGKFA